MARKPKKPAITNPWHIHGPGDKAIRKTEKLFLEGYKDELKNLNDLLVDFFNRNATNGLLTYADVAADGRLSSLLHRIREGVDKAFDLRKKVISGGLRSAADDAYTDILYQAEKLAYARTVSRNKTNILPMESRLDPAVLEGVGDMYNEWFGGQGMNGIRPTEEALNALHEHSQAQLHNRLRAALTGAGTDIRTWQRFLQDELSKDAGRFLRVLHTDGNRIINEAKLVAFESNYFEAVKSALGIREDGFVEGTGMCMIWRHDEPKTAREWHITQLDNTVADLDGFWWSKHDGMISSARGPGQFGVDIEDNYCRCYIDFGFPEDARGMSTKDGVVPVPANYLEERRKRRAA